MLARPGGRRHRALGADRLLRVRPPARPLRRRALQGLRRGRRRGRLGGGSRGARARAPLRGRGQGPAHPRDHPRLRRQPGRCLQRPHRPQRPRAGAGDPPGLGQCSAGAGGRRRGRGPRDRHHARRPDRGGSAARHLRAAARGPAAARLGQVEHRPHPGGRGCRRRDQDGAGAARGRAAEDPPRRRSLEQGRVGCRGGRAADRGGRVEAGGPPAPRGRLLVRHQRHQRARDLGGGAGAFRRGSRAGSGRPRRLLQAGGSARPVALRALGEKPGGTGGRGGMPRRAGRGGPRPRSHRPLLLPGDHQGAAGAASGRGGGAARGTVGRARLARQGRALTQHPHRQGDCRPPCLPLHRPGLTTTGDGQAALRDLPGLRPSVG